MPSSISSSEAASTGLAGSVLAMNAADGVLVPERFERPDCAPLTAADRPGIAQPVPERHIPSQPWGPILLGAVVLFVLLLGAWEGYWRAFGATAGYRNSDGQWAQERRRINAGEGDATVLIGSSRVLFDVQLPVWEERAGERPIQLALEGTSPVPVLEDLAADPDFTGRLLVGVAPDLFFSGFAYRGKAIAHYHQQGPSQRSGHWLSQHLLEPYFAFYEPDFALATVLKRQDWPARPGVHGRIAVRKLMVQEQDRNTQLWEKVQTDTGYRALARRIWAQDFGQPLPGMATPEKKQKLVDEQIARAATAIATLRARGVQVLFLRPPSDGEYYAYEQKHLPRAQTWDLLLQRTGAPGIHFEDYPQLQDYQLPEWSHMTASEANRFTAVLVPIVEREFAHDAPKTGALASR